MTAYVPQMTAAVSKSAAACEAMSEMVVSVFMTQTNTVC